METLKKLLIGFVFTTLISSTGFLINLYIDYETTKTEMIFDKNIITKLKSRIKELEGARTLDNKNTALHNQAYTYHLKDCTK